MSKANNDVIVAMHPDANEDEYKPNYRYGEPDLLPHGGAAPTVEGA